MSAVTVAVIAGFVCCALLIRVLGARSEGRDARSVVVDDDRARTWHATAAAPFDARG